MPLPSALSQNRLEGPEELRAQLTALYRTAVRDIGRGDEDEYLADLVRELRSLCCRIEEMQSLLEDEEDSPELDAMELSLGIASLTREVERVRTLFVERLNSLGRGLR